MTFEDYRKHEVAFCAEGSKRADRYFETRPDLSSGNSDIESFGRGSQKRHDLRFYERAAMGRGALALSAEVKLPGTAHGRSPLYCPSQAAHSAATLGSNGTGNLRFLGCRPSFAIQPLSHQARYRGSGVSPFPLA